MCLLRVAIWIQIRLVEEAYLLQFTAPSAAASVLV